MLHIRIILFLLTFTGGAFLSPVPDASARNNFTQQQQDDHAVIYSYQNVIYAISNHSFEDLQPTLQRTKLKTSLNDRFIRNTSFITTELGNSFLYLKNSKTVALRLSRYAIAFLFHAFP